MSIRDNFRSRTHKVLISLPYILLAAGIGICVLSAVRLNQINNAQKSQIAADLWSGDSEEKFRQISCFAIGQAQADGSPDLFFSSSVSLNTDDIKSIRTNLDSIVLAASGKKENSKTDKETTSEDDDKKLWIDAYSAETTSVVVRKATDVKPEASAEVTLTGVSGDYYLFHPMKMLAGAFLSDDTLDPKKIVIDKELAFKLFGSYNAVGSEVMINERAYTIVGVLEYGDTKIDKKTSGDLVHAYILFEELNYLSSAAANLTGTTSQDAVFDSEGQESPALAITCYEVVLPNKIRGIALQNLQNAMETAGKVEKNFLFVDNTDRFSPLRLYDTIFPIGDNTIDRQAYKLPFWELSAQTAESVSVFWWVAGLAGLLTAITSGLAIYAGTSARKVRRV